MNYNYKYRLYPTPSQEDQLAWTLDTCRHVYNHFLNQLNEANEIPSRYDLQGTLPDLKRNEWPELKNVHSKVLQMVVKRLYDNLSSLSGAKKNGRKVGRLRYKGESWYKTFTYNQSGFKLIKTGTRNDRLRLSKIGDIPIRYHRELPEEAVIKQIKLKRDSTGTWWAIFGIETEQEAPEPTPLDEIENPVGIDVGICKYTHDSNNLSVGFPDFAEACDRLAREQRKLSRRQKGSNNYEKQRVVVAKAHTQLVNQRRDFLHKLSSWYVKNHDFIAVEDLNTTGLLEKPRNSRNVAHAAWRTFIDMLAYKAESAGTHFVKVNPRGTTKECSQCGVSSEKPLWVREHSCPSCEFECDRDLNAAYNILQRAFSEVGQGMPESTPAETGAAVDATVVSASLVVETGSPVLNARSA
ncbi:MULTISPECIES: transposase [unclassified Haloferax]|uniref:RNA-guided endonuclease InsQ/TnpB family protein n=1 Tax=unclassified Haloferax TaxID=2625095 RepID=UPI002876708E|nr:MULTISPECIES: transposase [unclassified Haloferax]MDS0243740.1 transposase [Haloferax sp. S2CR25]MDS0446861.1 transposase [Haloferax sp. S2CR25-2]